MAGGFLFHTMAWASIVAKMTGWAEGRRSWRDGSQGIGGIGMVLEAASGIGCAVARVVLGDGTFWLLVFSMVLCWC